MKLKISNASGRVQAETVLKCKQQASLHYHAPRITEGDLHTSTAHQQQYGDRIVNPARVGKALSAQFNKLYTFFRVCGDILVCHISSTTPIDLLQNASAKLERFSNVHTYMLSARNLCQDLSSNVCISNLSWPTKCQSFCFSCWISRSGNLSKANVDPQTLQTLRQFYMTQVLKCFSIIQGDPLELQFKVVSIALLLRSPPRTSTRFHLSEVQGKLRFLCTWGSRLPTFRDCLRLWMKVPQEGAVGFVDLFNTAGMKHQQHLHAGFESFLVFPQMESQHESLKVARLATRMIGVRNC